MDYRVTARASFSASHVVKDHKLCGRGDGHRWRVSVTIVAGVDPATGFTKGSDELGAAVSAFAAELDREHINDMLPGSPPTPEGVGLALRERLSLDWPGIEEITVEMDDFEVSMR